MHPNDYNQVVRDFKFQATLLLKEALNIQDVNYHSPLHVASFFGDFKASRVMVKKGAEPSSAAYPTRPLEVGKDKFSRGVLQNLNKAATEANTKELKFLVNCGNQIDKRQSIFGEAPIHKAVLSHERVEEKKVTLDTILEQCHANVNNIDSNGWTALHHSAYIGDLESASSLIENGANVNAFSNQQRTPLHMAAAKNHIKLIAGLLMRHAELEQLDEQKCTPLHMACKKGSNDAVTMLLQNGANIYAQDERSWTALHYAAYNGHAQIVNFLLKWEADGDALADMRTSQSRLAFNMAKDQETKKAFIRK